MTKKLGFMLPILLMGFALSLVPSQLCADEIGREGFEDFELGSPDGQFGWQTTPGMDHEIVASPTIEGQRSLRISSEWRNFNLGESTQSALLGKLAGLRFDPLPIYHGFFRASFDFTSAYPGGWQRDLGVTVCVVHDSQSSVFPCVALLRILDQPDGLQVTYLPGLDYALNTYERHGHEDCSIWISGGWILEPPCSPHGGIIIASGLARDIVHSIDIQLRFTDGSFLNDGAFTDILMVTVNDSVTYVGESSSPSSGKHVGSIAFGDWKSSVQDWGEQHPGRGILIDNVSLLSDSPGITELTVTPNPVLRGETLHISAIASATPSSGIPELSTTETGPYPGIGNWTVAWAQWAWDGRLDGFLHPQDGAFDSPVEIVEATIPVPYCGMLQLCLTATDEIGGAYDINWRAHEAGIMGLPECVSVEVICPAVITSFTTSPALIDEGGTTTLSWSVSDADSCTTSGSAGDWAGSAISLPSGSMNVTIAVTGTYDFLLDCSNAVSSDLASATVGVRTPDNDGDGVADDEDLDDDNDGQLDSAELACGGDPLDPSVLAPDWDDDGNPDCMDSDDDNDFVDDESDICPDTLIPDGGLTSVEELGKNRWSLLLNTTGNFIQAPPQAGSKHNFTSADTGGCSCEQIIVAKSLGNNHLERGCSTSVILDWINQ